MRIPNLRPGQRCPRLLSASALLLVGASLATFGACGSSGANRLDESAARPMNDVTPVGGLGSLVVKGIPSIPSGARIDFKSEADKKNVVNGAALGAPYALKSGSYCISLINVSALTRCGFQVVAGKTLEVNIAQLNLSWNPEITLADVGEQVRFGLFDPASIAHEKPFLDIDATELPQKFPRPVLVFEGKVKVTWGVSALQGESRDLEAVAGSSHDFDITPPDERTLLQVKVNPARYDSPESSDSSYVANYAGLVHYAALPSPDTSLDSNVLPTSFWDKQKSGNGKGSYHRIMLDAKGSQMDLRVWPLAQGDTQGQLALVVNNIVVPVETKPRSTVPVIVDVINVNHINGTEPGCYELSQLSPFGDGTPARAFRFFYVTGSGATQPSGNVACFPTRTTIHVPKGWAYTVDAFLTDASGARVPQSSDVVDLRGQGR